MRNKSFLIIITGLLLLPITGYANASETIPGWYLNHHRGVCTTTHVTMEGDVVTVDIKGGHIGYGPEAMASGDCHVVATGKLQGMKLVADFLPTEWDSKHRQVSMTFGKNQLEIHGADLEGRCGWYTCFWGVYKKLSCKELKALFSKELSHYREHPEELESLCR